MSSHIEIEIGKALSALSGGQPCLALAREALAELSDNELAGLSSRQLEKWRKLGSAERRLEWSEARRSEKAIHDRLGDGAVTSVAHTRAEGRPFVFVIGANGVARVGIDVELRSRAVSESVAARFIREDEERFGLQPLEIWVIKEALFKADPQNAGTAISAHSIEAFDPSAERGRGRILGGSGPREADFALLRLSDWVLAVAVSR